MAIYRSEDLLTQINVLKGPGLYRLKKHLKEDGPHGTDQCYYCNDFARDVGLLPEPIQ